ncbi:hypothetical protein QFZ75_005748 [Streptomyces sp. V3I8]|uniref:hypothetical protein n=1 Tax=Streptomyces sp. V3I8 TaxID=3042279 RepID=UPI0027823498|nr:hypothetical protein [Streptomyces sp. V3I8]MDQ1039332.1 hypothetical protein [Streptomyces sp. V3I8]
MGPHIRNTRRTRYVPYVRHRRTALTATLTSLLPARSPVRAPAPVPATSPAAASPRFPARGATGRILAGTLERTGRTAATSHRFLPDDPTDSVTCHAPHTPGPGPTVR